jgi:hypothetical protein
MVTINFTEGKIYCLEEVCKAADIVLATLPSESHAEGGARRPRVLGCYVGKDRAHVRIRIEGILFLHLVVMVTKGSLREMLRQHKDPLKVNDLSDLSVDEKPFAIMYEEALMIRKNLKPHPKTIECAADTGLAVFVSALLWDLWKDPKRHNTDEAEGKVATILEEILETMEFEDRVHSLIKAALGWSYSLCATGTVDKEKENLYYTSDNIVGHLEALAATLDPTGEVLQPHAYFYLGNIKLFNDTDVTEAERAFNECKKSSKNGYPPALTYLMCKCGSSSSLTLEE